MDPTNLTPDDIQALNTLASQQATLLRVARQALVPTVGQGYVNSVAGHQVSRGGQLSIKPNQSLQPIEISRHFFLYREQTADSDTLTKLIAFAAADIAQAEDAIILLGSAGRPQLKSLQITLDDPEALQSQPALFDENQADIQEGAILNSILGGIKILQKNGNSGDYYAIVSPELYEEAYKNTDTTTDAPIYQIQPLLKGFLFSEAAEGRKGVIFSLARQTVSLSVPMDLYLDTSLPNDSGGRPQFRLAQQFRLIIDDPDARAPLK